MDPFSFSAEREFIRKEGNRLQPLTGSSKNLTNGYETPPKTNGYLRINDRTKMDLDESRLEEVVRPTPKRSSRE